MPTLAPQPTAPAAMPPAGAARLSAHQIELIQADWAAVVPMADAAAALFYGRLFELDPALRPLFRADLAEQGRKLMTALGLTVRSLPDSAALAPALLALGRRHAGYGAQPAHYDTVGAALLWTLGQGLGAGFDDEHHAAWAAAYGWVAETMQAGQAQAGSLQPGAAASSRTPAAATA